MAMKVCQDCGTELSSKAKICPKCGRDQRNFYSKHKVLIIIFAIICVLAIGLAAGQGTNDIGNTVNVNSSISSSKVTKENYDKISKGMTKQQVKEILGEPQSVSENETPGVGKMELNHYQESFRLKGIDIYYLNGKVYMKNWTEL